MTELNNTFKIFRLILCNQSNNIKYSFIYDKKWWNFILNDKFNMEDLDDILDYDYLNFVILIKKIDNKIQIVNDILYFLSLSKCHYSKKIDNLYSDLWYID